MNNNNKKNSNNNNNKYHIKNNVISKRIKMSETTVISPCSNLSALIYKSRGCDHHHHQHHHHHNLQLPSHFDLIRHYGYDVTDNKTSDLYNKQAFFIMNDNFHREDERLKTFENWPLAWLDKKQLAQTGMFFTGEGDKVKCYFCEVEIGRWELEDQPVPEHLRWSPNCPLLRRRTTNNVPINADELNHILPAISYDVCGTHDSFESRPNVFYAEYPEYAIETSRERSFTDWPEHMKQTPAQMAEAGFFHSGDGDRVKCFSCGGGLKDWDDTDVPWEQHALWLPKCRFLKLMKGQDFIDDVIAKQRSTQSGGGGEGEGGCADNESSVNEKPICSTQVTTATTTTNTSATNTTNTSDVKQSSTTTATTKATATATTKSSSNQTSCCTEAASSILCDTIATTTGTTTTTNSSSCSNIPEEKLCKICYTDEYNTAFLPCGHVVACAKCASSVNKCPMCRKHFTDIMRVYFS